MNVCVVGKYPPIEGGVCKGTYWAARRLAERGHHVWVVTNSDEVEPEYRMHLAPEDREWLEPTFPTTGGFVKVRQLERPDPRRMGHIPRTSATVSRMAGAVIDTIRTHHCDVCLAYYLEPYGVACYLAHQQTGVPYVMKHAGSDIDRLMLVPDLAELYREVWRRAGAVMTRQELAGRFLQMGIDPTRFAIGLGFDIPDIFNPSHPPLDVAAVLDNPEGKAFAHIPLHMRRREWPDLATPTIGIYGKIGETKGSYDLVRALRKVKDSGLRFNLLCMGNGIQFPRFVKEVEDADLIAETWLLPFLPHWRVPAFLRACTAVCFLERDFPVKIHGPGVPQEIMSCGVCLILSGEIDQKQRGRLDVRPDETALVVKDPKDHNALATALTRVIRDPAWAASIGRAGHDVLRQRLVRQAGARSAAEDYERMLEAVAARRPVTGVVGVTADVTPTAGTVDQNFAVRALLPRCTRLLDSTRSTLWASFHEQHGSTLDRRDAVEIALAFASFLIDASRKPTVPATEPSYPYLGDVAALEADILRAFADRDRVPRDVQSVHHARVDLLELERVFREALPLPTQLADADLQILIVPQSNFSVKLFTMTRKQEDTVLAHG